MKKKNNIVWGLVLILIGIVLILKTFNIWNFNIFFKGFWTLFIIIPSLINFFTEKNKIGSIIGIFIGVSLLLACQGIITFSTIWKLFLPVIFIIFGVSLIFKDRNSKDVKLEIEKLEHRDTKAKEYYATFSSQNLNFANEELENMELNAIFGGIEANYLNSNLNKDIFIKVSAIFGGVDITLPSDYTVKVVSNSLFGGVSNKRIQGNSKKVIYIEALCLFGGLDIK